MLIIDDLSSCGGARNISEIITSAVEMAEVFNDYFATIGSNLASEIQPSSTEPEFYLQPTDTLHARIHCTVCRLLNQLDAKKNHWVRQNSL